MFRNILLFYLNIYSDNVVFSELARSTNHFNGAMLKSVCVEAVFFVLKFNY